MIDLDRLRYFLRAFFAETRFAVTALVLVEVVDPRTLLFDKRAFAYGTLFDVRLFEFLRRGKFPSRRGRRRCGRGTARSPCGAGILRTVKSALTLRTVAVCGSFPLRTAAERRTRAPLLRAVSVVSLPVLRTLRVIIIRRTRPSLLRARAFFGAEHGF